MSSIIKKSYRFVGREKVVMIVTIRFFFFVFDAFNNFVKSNYALQYIQQKNDAHSSTHQARFVVCVQRFYLAHS
jgi:hypothetical protein